MKKDIQNVVITFSLVGVMLYSGSFFYAQKVKAEEERAFTVALEEEKTQRAEEILQATLIRINTEQEQQLAELRRKAEESTVAPVAVPAITRTAAAPTKTVPASTNTSAATQAALAQKQQADLAKAQAQAQADAALRAQQIADAQKAAQAQAKADAAAKTAAAKKARTSRAS